MNARTLTRLGTGIQVGLIIAYLTVLWAIVTLIWALLQTRPKAQEQDVLMEAIRISVPKSLQITTDV